MESKKNFDGMQFSQTTVDNATEAVEYLDELRKSVNPPQGSTLTEDRLAILTDISDAAEGLGRVRRDFSWDSWFDADKRLPGASTHSAIVANVANVVGFGCFVELPDGLHGLVHISNMNGHVVGPGDRVEVEVIWIDVIQTKMSLRLIEIVEEDAGDSFTPTTAGS